MDNGVKRWPRLAIASADPGQCLPYMGPECGACRDSCPVSGAMVWEMEKPRIEITRCTGCGLCREACIQDPSAVHISAWVRETESE